MNRFDPRIYLFTLGHFSVDWAQRAIPALLPYFISACSLSYQDAGSLAFANILLSSVAQPVFGYYADKVSKPWVAPLGILMTGISLSVMPFASGITLGLSTTFGGLVTPLIGWAADTFGLVPAFQILWIVAIPGAMFLHPEIRQERRKNLRAPSKETGRREWNLIHSF